MKKLLKIGMVFTVVLLWSVPGFLAENNRNQAKEGNAPLSAPDEDVRKNEGNLNGRNGRNVDPETMNQSPGNDLNLNEGEMETEPVPFNQEQEFENGANEQVSPDSGEQEGEDDDD